MMMMGVSLAVWVWMEETVSIAGLVVLPAN
jgi:hypothetical protein